MSAGSIQANEGSEIFVTFTLSRYLSFPSFLLFFSSSLFIFNFFLEWQHMKPHSPIQLKMVVQYQVQILWLLLEPFSFHQTHWYCYNYYTHLSKFIFLHFVKWQERSLNISTFDDLVYNGGVALTFSLLYSSPLSLTFNQSSTPLYLTDISASMARNIIINNIVLNCAYLLFLSFSA